jgi:hypothetical protein
MQIKFGQMWGSSLTLSHSGKNTAKLRAYSKLLTMFLGLFEAHMKRLGPHSMAHPTTSFSWSPMPVE